MRFHHRQSDPPSRGRQVLSARPAAALPRLRRLIGHGLAVAAVIVNESHLDQWLWVTIPSPGDSLSPAREYGSIYA